MIKFKIILDMTGCRVFYAMQDITSYLGINPAGVKDVLPLPGETFRKRTSTQTGRQYEIWADYATLLANRQYINAYVVR